MDLILIHGDLTQVDAEGVVNPANSLGEMGGGVAGLLRHRGGDIIEEEAKAMAPILVGTAVATSAGKLPFRYVIHAPTMERPAMKTTPEKVALATVASLACADASGLRSLAIPGMGTGVGRVSHADAARVMVEAARRFTPRNLVRVLFVAFEEQMVQAFEAQGLKMLGGGR
ncbi:MAG: O-acetyl-ADP-ribose deacetylase [Acidobacteria bacterium]|nr:MAG: O-acetyl-ADP-ribose deacetylase [Acidobacteriota bacterium]